MMRMLATRLAIISAFAFACAIALSPARALETREVEAVVTVLEQLASETGDTVYYDEDAAEEWFEIDEDTSRLIPAAGFSRASWKTAFDRTMTGFIATIPRAEMELMMEEFTDRLGEIAKMTPEQKEEANAMLRAEMGTFEAVRARGAPYRGTVAPYAQRLRKLSLHR